MFKLLGIKQITPSQRDVLKNLFTKKIDKYVPSITFLTKYQMIKFEKRCLEENIPSSYEIDVNYKYKNDYNKVSFIIYLTKEKAKENIRALKDEKKYTMKFSGVHFKKICRETLNNSYKFAHVFANIKSSEGDDNPDTYFPPENNYWSIPSSKDVELYKKPTKKTITIGFKKRSKKGFIEKFNIKDKIENYYPKLIYLSEPVFKRYINHIKKIIKAEKKFGQTKLIKNKSTFSFLASFYHFIDGKGFIFYLAKTQIKKLTESRKKGLFRGIKTITFTNNQLVKTYKKVIKINSEIYRYLKYMKVDRYYENKPNTSPKLLALTDKPNNPPKLLALTDKPNNPTKLLALTENLEKDLIDFGNDKDLIYFGDDLDFKEEKDLIDFNTIIPPKKPSPPNLLNDEELFPIGKKYKVLQDEDLIPTSNKSTTDGANILKNILNYPETKRILGVSLTSDLKEKRKNLDSEASFGMANILSSLLTANRGKMSIYSISRNQLKEIIEGFITTLSILLNPAQKY